MHKDSTNSLKKNTMMLVIFAIISKLIGILREILLAKYFGTSYQFDAYIISINVPLIIVNIFFGNIFISAIISEINRLKYNGEEFQIKELISSIFIFIASFSFLFILIVFLFPKDIIYLLAPGFNFKTQVLAVKLVHISIFIVLFMALASTLQGFLNAKKHFIYPGLRAITLNVIILIFLIFLTPKIGIYSIAIGFLIGALGQVIIQIPSFTRLYDLKTKVSKIFNKKLLINFLSIFLPFIVIGFFHQMVLIVDKIVASTLGVGNISGLYFSEKLMELPQSIFGLSLATVIFPTLSTLSELHSKEEFNILLRKSISFIFFVILPIVYTYFLFSRPIVVILFKRGLFNINSVEITSASLRFYSFAALFITINTIITKGFLASKKIKKMILIDFISISVNIILNIILSKYIGIKGITLATSISTALFFFLAVYSLDLKFDWLMNLLKIAILQFIAFYIVKYISVDILKINLNNIFNLTIILLIIFILIIIISKLFRIKEFHGLMEMINKKFLRKRKKNFP